MAGLSTWRSWAGRLLAALVLTVLTLGPSLDALICKDEGGLSAAAAESTVIALQDADHSNASHQLDGLGTCVHGHCHHPAPYVPADVAVSDIAPTGTLGRYRMVTDAVPTSDAQFGLIRPPRA